MRRNAALRRSAIDPARAQDWSPGVVPGEGAHTTHLTVADGDGMVVSATQTINSLFGARYMVPGTGMIPNNYLYVFNPRPGLANSLAPGKRVTSSMAPLIVLRDGKPRFALGMPGGLRIFPSVMQALVKLIELFNRVHELETELTDEQLRAILLKTDSWLMYILQISSGNFHK